MKPEHICQATHTHTHTLSLLLPPRFRALSHTLSLPPDRSCTSWCCKHACTLSAPPSTRSLQQHKQPRTDAVSGQDHYSTQPTTLPPATCVDIAPQCTLFPLSAVCRMRGQSTSATIVVNLATPQYGVPRSGDPNRSALSVIVNSIRSSCTILRCCSSLIVTSPDCTSLTMRSAPGNSCR
jgi:hypothetical protein